MSLTRFEIVTTFTEDELERIHNPQPEPEPSVEDYSLAPGQFLVVLRDQDGRALGQTILNENDVAVGFGITVDQAGVACSLDFDRRGIPVPVTLNTNPYLMVGDTLYITELSISGSIDGREVWSMSAVPFLAGPEMLEVTALGDSERRFIPAHGYHQDHLHVSAYQTGGLVPERTIEDDEVGHAFDIGPTQVVDLHGDTASFQAAWEGLAASFRELAHNLGSALQPLVSAVEPLASVLDSDSSPDEEEEEED